MQRKALADKILLLGISEKNISLIREFDVNSVQGKLEEQFDEEKLKDAQEVPPVINEPQKNMIIDFEDYRLQREQEEKAKTQRWLKAIEAVKKNNITPLDLKEIESKEELDDPTATEILAFMYARGIGVKMDLIKAFKLYRKAERLNIPNAKENAIKVYKDMTPHKRAKLNTAKKK